ncbi:MAG: NADP-dependent methylenetetrahydromethanopterin/methylenetetrahydrofolate dehydrogenase [Planctomycetota bacterium]
MTQRILLQLDCDHQPSSFDSVVAIDAGVERLLTYADVQVTTIVPLVHGAMFTRGGDDLRNTAIFIGGSDVAEAEALFRIATGAFFGPVRVSVMLDANGCNTTAAAAVVAAGRHVELSQSKAVVLGGTGPVGRRAAQMLASVGATVSLTSRSIERASEACKQIAERVEGAKLNPQAPYTSGQVQDVVADADIVIASGAAGVQLISQDGLSQIETLKVAIDLNAVPPAGIEGIGVTDKAKPLTHGVGYGAIGVGGLKMRTHKAAINQLFESNDKQFDADEIFQIAQQIDE